MITIYFASNRNVVHETSNSCRNLGKRFNADGPQFFRVGEASAELDGDPYNDDDWRAADCKLFAEELDDSDIRIGSPRFFGELRDILKSTDKDIVIYIHGFANTFANSVERAAALQEIYARTWDEKAVDWNVAGQQSPIVVMFSWPSNGNVFPRYEYFSDREDAEASGLAMARALERFVSFLMLLREGDRGVIRRFANEGLVPSPDDMAQCHRKLHLIAHSMGGLALRHALLKFANLPRRAPLPRILDNIFLMAADEDADALGDPSKLALLTDLANAVHVYHSNDDRALQISDKTKGNPDRLGSDGPDNFATLNERVFAVDCRHVDRTIVSHGNHQYYRLRKEVIEDTLMTVANVPLDGRDGRTTLVSRRAWRLKAQ